jgi:plasmid stabilization system protein ParE
VTRRNLIIRPAAEFDLEEAARWYDKQRTGLSDELLAEVRSLLETVQERPESFPVAYRQARRARLKRFPYAVYFQLRGDTISVIAILHTSQDSESRLGDRF